MVATYSYSFCLQAQVEVILSEEGVRNYLDDDRQGEAIASYVTDCIEMATAEIMMYCSARYSRETLQQSVWVKWTAATMTAYFITRRKGFESPASLVARYTSLIDTLKLIQQGGMSIPELAERNESAPAMSNVTIDSRFQTAKTRVERTISTGKQPANGITQNVDVTEHNYPQYL